MVEVESECLDDLHKRGGSAVITVVFRAKITLDGNEIDLGEFDSQEEAEQAIIVTEAEHDRDVEEAANPPQTQTCYNCHGTGKLNNDECNMCAGTGRVPL